MDHLQISGIYPHLCAFNQPTVGVRDLTHGEVGIGAVVPWAGKLWYITYPQHQRTGSNDKLHRVDEDLNLTLCPESVGGTHACRMIHRESHQLIIGPYFIDADGHVRAADVNELEGRLTAVARHLTDPANLVYFLDMEGKLYEVNVHTLAVKLLFMKPVPGWHAKGGYTGQGRFIMANNGESGGGGGGSYADILVGGPAETDEDAGILASWDGATWSIIERRQFLDVTGPGGLYGAPDDDAPVWSFGWDKRSLILKLLDGGQWHTFRMPKGSHTFDPKHGWYTEWPRIREIAPGQPAMCAHGSLFDFPITFSAANTAGIRPICTHLRYVPDIGYWNDRIVLAADDSSMMENPLCGQPQSNLWFGDRAALQAFGPRQGWGGVWVQDAVKAGETSAPLLIAGYKQRVIHLAQQSDAPVTFTLAIGDGQGNWRDYRTVDVPANGYVPVILDADEPGEWLTVTVDQDCTASAYGHFLTPRAYPADEPALFAALPDAGDASPQLGGIIRPSAMHRGLEWVRQRVDADGRADARRQVDVMAEPTKIVFGRPASDQLDFVVKTGECTKDFEVDDASVIVTDIEGRQWRIPKGPEVYDQPFATGWPRGVREVVSERFLANLHGTLYEVPRTGSRAVPRWQQMKPVATHHRRIADYCTWNGLFVISGTKLGATPDGQYFAGGDGEGLWFGCIDDLWKLGKPRGIGGPWRATAVKADEESLPYLMTGYDDKVLELSHAGEGEVLVTVKVDIDHEESVVYGTFTVPAGEVVRHEFPVGFNAHWARLSCDREAVVTAVFRYA